jgi:hypothetical protein
MADEIPTDDGQWWPKQCADCGTDLEQAVTGFDPDHPSEMPRGDLGAAIGVDYCPNPDCPAKAEERPGSLGGDNGGG